MQPDPDQPRKYFDEQALAELKASIEKHGVLQPVLVRHSVDGSLFLVSENKTTESDEYRYRLKKQGYFRAELL